MAWGKKGKPTWKYCPGYGRLPHRCRYDKDFNMNKRRLKSGKIAYYAETYCRRCKNSYLRELRRMNNRLSGKATRPQDVPWKRYRRKQDETWMRGVSSRSTNMPSAPFFEWFDEWLRRQNLTITQACVGAGISTRTVRRWRQVGTLQLHSAEKFFAYAQMPHLSVVLYHELQTEEAA